MFDKHDKNLSKSPDPNVGRRASRLNARTADTTDNEPNIDIDMYSNDRIPSYSDVRAVEKHRSVCCDDGFSPAAIQER